MSWKIDTLTYANKTFYGGDDDFWGQNLQLKPDGTKLYVFSAYNVIKQYALVTPYDIDTAVYEKSGIASQQATHNGFFIKPDGTRVYVINSGNRRIYQYTLSTPWDISSISGGTYGEMIEIINEEEVPISYVVSMFIKPDGLKVYAVSRLTDDVYQFSLSSAWDITTISIAEAKYDVSGEDNAPHSISFNPDGSKMYYKGSENPTAIFQYSLSTSWSIATLSFDNEWGSVAGETEYTDDFFIDPSGTRVYVLNTIAPLFPLRTFRIWQYALIPDAPTNVVATDGVHTDKVVINWTKSGGISQYIVYRGITILGPWLGDVDTYDDENADYATITNGSVIASDGGFAAHVAVSNPGASANPGTVHSYRVRCRNIAGTSPYSIADDGHRGVGVLTYQWYKSAEDSDANYSIISGADESTYDDTEAPAGSVPGTPTGLAATDGVHIDKVVLTWSNVLGEIGAGRYYKCYHTAEGTADPEYTEANRGYRGAYVSTDTQVKRDAVELEAIGSLQTSYDDAGADAPVITPGATVASDGGSTAHIALSLAGVEAKGTIHDYYVRTYNAAGWGNWTVTNTGYRGAELTYQWQKSAGDSDDNYSNIDGATSDTYDDTDAPAPTITPGAAIASDGDYVDHVALSLLGHSANVGEGRFYKCILNAEGCDQQISSSDRGYRDVGNLTFQWQKSIADSDANYSNIDGATTELYDDIDAPANGDGRYYKCILNADGADQQISAVDRGYRTRLVHFRAYVIDAEGNFQYGEDKTFTFL